MIFAAFGLMPVSLLLAGLVADVHVVAMLVGSGVLVALTTFAAGLSPATRHID